MLFRATSRQTHFYPRSPCGERPKSANTLPAVTLFLSTLSLRRATALGLLGWLRVLFFYPRSPCGERPWQRGSRITYVEFFYPRSPCGERQFIGFPYPVAQSFSIHALLAESDNSIELAPAGIATFLSTLSLRRATEGGLLRRCTTHFSIHALLAESDFSATWPFSGMLAFLSTLSLRRATSLFFFIFYSLSFFYPRSPCGERLATLCNVPLDSFFYPRSPCGERRAGRAVTWDVVTFLSTLSLRRATCGCFARCRYWGFFSIHALLAESDITI